MHPTIEETVSADAEAYRVLTYAERQLMLKRINRGMHLLDQKLGYNWPFHVNTDGLNLGSACRCVLGQLAVDIVPRRQWAHGRYRRFMPDYTHAADVLNLSDAKVVTHGFLASGYSAGALTHAWRVSIKARAGAR